MPCELSPDILKLRPLVAIGTAEYRYWGFQVSVLPPVEKAASLIEKN
jgi:hypothetical protein